MRVRAYPVAERYGWVWVWMGDLKTADEALIPDFHYLVDPRYAAVGKTTHVDANYLLVNDNLTCRTSATSTRPPSATPPSPRRARPSR